MGTLSRTLPKHKKYSKTEPGRKAAVILSWNNPQDDAEMKKARVLKFPLGSGQLKFHKTMAARKRAAKLYRKSSQHKRRTSIRQEQARQRVRVKREAADSGGRVGDYKKYCLDEDETMPTATEKDEHS